MNKQMLLRAALLGAVLMLAGNTLPSFAQSHGAAHMSGARGGMHAGPAHPHGGPANGGWHGRGGARGWWGPGVGIGLGWGFPYYGYPGPYYYAYPAPAVGSPDNSYWYYCASAQTYFPYVSQCPEGWQVVPAMPATPTP